MGYTPGPIVVPPPDPDAPAKAEARRRQAWAISAERRRANLILAVLAALALAAIILVAILTEGTYVLVGDFKLDPVVICVFFIAVVGALYKQYRADLRAYAGDRELLKNETAELQREEDRIAADGQGSTFEQLWAVNQRRINLYQGIAANQAKTSFVSSQLAAAVGLLVILGVAGLVAVSSNSTNAIAASVVGTVGAGFSAYVGSTFIKVQRSAAEQLRNYFAQPVEFARVLTAERLLANLTSDEDKALIVAKILDLMVDAPPASEKKD